MAATRSPVTAALRMNSSDIMQGKAIPRIEARTQSEWDRILAVDLTGLYEVSKAAARVMRARGTSTSFAVMIFSSIP